MVNQKVLKEAFDTQHRHLCLFDKYFRGILCQKLNTYLKNRLVLTKKKMILTIQHQIPYEQQLKNQIVLKEAFDTQHEYLGLC